MKEIIYPTLDLFLYDLRDGLGENSEAIKANQDYFKAKLPLDLHDSLFKRDTEFEAKYVPLLEKHSFYSNDQKIEGCYEPVRIGDTYGLLFNCSSTDHTSLKEVKFLQCLKDFIDSNLNGKIATVGRTWMVSGELPTPLEASPIDLAKSCYECLMPHGNWELDLRGEGRFQGGYIFDLWRYQVVMKEDLDKETDPEDKEAEPQDKETKKEPPTIEKIQENQHFIIALYPNAASAGKAAGYYRSWIRLFSYRAKIMWNYGQSRYLKQLLKQDFVGIQENMKKIKFISNKRPKLEEIQKILKEAQETQSNYLIHLSNFDYQIKSLKTNLDNYNNSLSVISHKAQSVRSSLILPPHLNYCQDDNNLQFFQAFSEIVAKKYFRQMQTDYENFSPGIPLLEGLMNSITSLRLIVETDQAQRDRTFQNTIGIVGAGLAGASLTASISGQFPNVIVPVNVLSQEEAEAIASKNIFELGELGFPNPWVAPSISLLLSLAAAIFFGGLTAVVIKMLEQRSR